MAAADGDRATLGSFSCTSGQQWWAGVRRVFAMQRMRGCFCVTWGRVGGDLLCPHRTWMPGFPCNGLGVSTHAPCGLVRPGPRWMDGSQHTLCSSAVRVVQPGDARVLWPGLVPDLPRCRSLRNAWRGRRPVPSMQAAHTHTRCRRQRARCSLGDSARAMAEQGKDHLNNTATATASRSTAGWGARRMCDARPACCGSTPRQTRPAPPRQTHPLPPPPPQRRRQPAHL